MREKQSVLGVLGPRYRRGSKSQKQQILDECCQLTGYNRCYASSLLSGSAGKVIKSSCKKRPRRRVYDERVASALKRIWFIMDCICGKRLAPILGEIIKVLIGCGELRLSAETGRKLAGISAATIDRLLAKEKKKLALASRARTKPGTLLKSQIPIRTFSEWDDARPGFVEIDLVAHDGGDASGHFLQTLDVTDVSTGWTETQAVLTKAQVFVFDALIQIRKRLPFKLLGIDSDNGSEFINDQLLRFCQSEQITFTRARSYRKNDNCFVEQKNYSVVRRNVGYLRHETERELHLLNELYRLLRLYTNYFQPVMKLISKERIGARVRKKYDRPQTPYQRLQASADVSKKRKGQLREVYERLNPAALKRKITRLQNELIEIAAGKKEPRSRNPKEPPFPSALHPWRRSVIPIYRQARRMEPSGE